MNPKPLLALNHFTVPCSFNCVSLFYLSYLVLPSTASSKKKDRACGRAVPSQSLKVFTEQQTHYDCRTLLPSRQFVSFLAFNQPLTVPRASPGPKIRSDARYMGGISPINFQAAALGRVRVSLILTAWIRACHNERENFVVGHRQYVSARIGQFFVRQVEETFNEVGRETENDNFS
jgi:hypothetical protein